MTTKNTYLNIIFFFFVWCGCIVIYDLLLDVTWKVLGEGAYWLVLGVPLIAMTDFTRFVFLAFVKKKTKNKRQSLYEISR